MEEVGKYNIIERHLRMYAFDTMIEYYKFEKACEENFIDAVINQKNQLLRSILFPKFFDDQHSDPIKLLNKHYYRVFTFKGNFYYSRSSVVAPLNVFPLFPSILHEDEEIQQFLQYLVSQKLYPSKDENDILKDYGGSYHRLLFTLLFETAEE